MGPRVDGISRGTSLSWHLQRDPRQLAPPDPDPDPPRGNPCSCLPPELVVAQQRHSPGAQGVVNGFGKFIHVFPFFIHIKHRNPLHKAQFQLPSSRSGAAEPLPGEHRPELLTGKYSITGNNLSFLPVLPFPLPPFFPSEQHWEYIQRVGVYLKCKCFCYTKRNGGES